MENIDLLFEQLSPEKVSLFEKLYKNGEPIIIIFNNKTYNKEEEVQTEHKIVDNKEQIQTYQRTNRIRGKLRKFNISKNLWDEVIHIFNLMVEVFYKQNPTRKKFISPNQCIKCILININQQPEANKIPVLKFEESQNIVDSLWESIKQMRL